MTNSRIPAAHALSEQVQLLPRPIGQSFSLPPDLLVSPRGPKRPVILRQEHVVRIGLLSLGGCDVPERLKFSRRSSMPRPPSVGALRAQHFACYANFSNGVGRHRRPRTSSGEERKQTRGSHLPPSPRGFFCQISPPPVSAVTCFLPFRLPTCCPAVFL